tara:strand:- start:159 stop:581 length:423 start_codon:yes stop_codon:yes gene_type:complete
MLDVNMAQNISISLFLVNFLIPFLFGSLVFFSAIVAPNTFINLSQKNARSFIRAIFPKIYLWAGIISSLITIFLFQLNVTYSFLFFIITIGYFFSREYLMKLINKASDQKKTKRFKSLHRVSVTIFISQLGLMLYIFLKI